MDFSILDTKNNQIILKGVRGYQFNKEIISVQCTVSDILRFLSVDKNVQRELDTNKVASISKYIQYGLAGNDIYFSPLIFSSRKFGSYNEKNREFILNMNETLTILDGQHRIKGFELFIKRLENYMSRNPNDKDIIQDHNTILNFPISIQIYRHLNLTEERQLFTDINTKASPVSNTLLIMYKEDDLYGQLVKDIIFNHPTISSDMFEYRAKTTKSKLMTAATLYTVSKILNEGSYIRNNQFKIDTNNYDLFKENTKQFLALLTKNRDFALDRDKFILYIPSVIEGIAMFIYKIKQENPSVSIHYLFNEIVNKVNWSHSNNDFRTLAIKFNKTTNKYNFGSTSRAINGICQYLTRKFNEGEQYIWKI